MAVEEPFVGKSAKSALAVGQAQAIALVSAAKNSIPVRKYTPAQVKYAVTNNGRASKEEVMAMIQAILSLPKTPESDAADALAVALCHLGAQRETEREKEAVEGIPAQTAKKAKTAKHRRGKRGTTPGGQICSSPR